MNRRRLRDGSSQTLPSHGARPNAKGASIHEYAGSIESVRAPTGDTVRVPGASPKKTSHVPRFWTVATTCIRSQPATIGAVPASGPEARFGLRAGGASDDCG